VDIFTAICPFSELKDRTKRKGEAIVITTDKGLQELSGSNLRMILLNRIKLKEGDFVVVKIHGV